MVQVLLAACDAVLLLHYTRGSYMPGPGQAGITYNTRLYMVDIAVVDIVMVDIDQSSSETVGLQ